MVSNNLKNLVRSAGEEGLQLMQHLLLWDPQKRPTAAQVCVCACVLIYEHAYVHMYVQMHVLNCIECS